MEEIKQKLLNDIFEEKRLKYHHFNYPDLSPTQMNAIIKELISEDKIVRDIVKKKNGMHYTSHVYLEAK